MKLTLNRAETIDSLAIRDGLYCAWIDCNYDIDENNILTIEHIIPRSKGGTDDLWNLELLCMKHNYYRANRDYIDYNNRILEPINKKLKPQRVQHPKPSQCCNQGRDLGPDDVCYSCGSTAQPYSYPHWAKLPPKECPHSGPWWCWAESLGIYDRVEASSDVFGILGE